MRKCIIYKHKLKKCKVIFMKYIKSGPNFCNKCFIRISTVAGFFDEFTLRIVIDEAEYIILSP